MKLEDNGQFRKIIAKNNYRITNKQRTIFVESLYLGKNDSQDNYDEVSKDIWGAFIKDSDTEILLDDMSKEISMLKDLLLDNDYRLVLLEEKTPGSSLNDSSYSITTKLVIFNLLQHRISSNTYNSKLDMTAMLDDYLRNKKILQAQYDGLVTLLG